MELSEKCIALPVDPLNNCKLLVSSARCASRVLYEIQKAKIRVLGRQTELVKLRPVYVWILWGDPSPVALRLLGL